MASNLTEAVERDADAFLERMRQAVGAFGPARVRELACAIAWRHLGDLGEDADSPRAMVKEAQALAATQPVPRARFEAWLGTLRGVSANVDPDRLGSPDVLRALNVVQLALQACTEGPPAGAGPFDVVYGALAVRALRSPPANEAERQSVREALRAKWEWEAVRAEARWLAAQVEKTVEPLATAAPVSSPPATKAPSPPAAKSPSPPAAVTAPRVIALPLAGHVLQFIGVDGDSHFRAMVDGQRCLVRERRVSAQVMDGGSRRTDEAQPAWAEATTADLTYLHRVLAAGAQPELKRGRTVLTWHQPGAHFRQNDWTTVAIAFAPDGVLEIETTLEWQDDSYY